MMILRRQLFFPDLIQSEEKWQELHWRRLIVDGRIHPARIEEMVEKAQKEVETMMREEGEAAALEVGVHGIHPELIRLLGTYEVQNELRSECTEAFNRGCSAIRTACG